MSTDILAVGVDGMEPDLVSKWIRAGELPNLKRLIEGGSNGDLAVSSLNSAKQWTTHFCGVLPEEHGISGFIRSEIGTSENREAGKKTSPNEKEIFTLNDIKKLTYPEILDRRGRSVGLINPLPLWPPLKLENGVCVSGMITPPDAKEFVHPPRFMELVDSTDYEIDVHYGDRPLGYVDDDVFDEVRMDTLRSDMFHILRSRIEFSKALIEQENLDLTYSLYKSIDIIQHCFWGAMEHGDNKFSDCILEAYQEVDEFLGWVLDNNHADNVIVFSDHGFKFLERPPDSLAKISSLAYDVLPTIPGPIKSIYHRLLTTKPSVDPENPDVITGHHDRPAFWAMAGEDIESEVNRILQFEDITVSILALLEEPIPEAYVGTPPTDILRVEPAWKELDLDIDRRRSIRPDERVTERLHNLGYAEMVEE